jgi:hypothetical protein
VPPSKKGENIQKDPLLQQSDKTITGLNCTPSAKESWVEHCEIVRQYKSRNGASRPSSQEPPKKRQKTEVQKNEEA